MEKNKNVIQENVLRKKSLKFYAWIVFITALVLEVVSEAITLFGHCLWKTADAQSFLCQNIRPITLNVSAFLFILFFFLLFLASVLRMKYGTVVKIIIAILYFLLAIFLGFVSWVIILQILAYAMTIIAAAFFYVKQ